MFSARAASCVAHLLAVHPGPDDLPPGPRVPRGSPGPPGWGPPGWGRWAAGRDPDRPLDRWRPPPGWGRPLPEAPGPRVVTAPGPAGPGSPGSRWACRPRSPGGPRRRACRRSGCQDRVAGLAAVPPCRGHGGRPVVGPDRPPRRRSRRRCHGPWSAEGPPRVASRPLVSRARIAQDRQNGVDCRTFMDIARVASFLPGAVSKPQDLRQKATRRCFRPAQLAGWARPAGSG